MPEGVLFGNSPAAPSPAPPLGSSGVANIGGSNPAAEFDAKSVMPDPGKIKPPEKSSVETEADRRKNVLAANVPQIDKDPIGAIGFVLRSVSAGFKGQRLPADEIMDDYNKRELIGLQKMQLGIQVLDHAAKIGQSVGEADKPRFVEAIKKQFGGAVPEIADLIEPAIRGGISPELIEMFGEFGPVLAKAANGNRETMLKLASDKDLMSNLKANADQRNMGVIQAKIGQFTKVLETAARTGQVDAGKFGNFFDPATGKLKDVTMVDLMKINQTIDNPSMKLNASELRTIRDNPGIAMQMGIVPPEVSLKVSEAVMKEAATAPIQIAKEVETARRKAPIEINKELTIDRGRLSDINRLYGEYQAAVKGGNSQQATILYDRIKKINEIHPEFISVTNPTGGELRTFAKNDPELMKLVKQGWVQHNPSETRLDTFVVRDASDPNKFNAILLNQREAAEYRKSGVEIFPAVQGQSVTTVGADGKPITITQSSVANAAGIAAAPNTGQPGPQAGAPSPTAAPEAGGAPGPSQAGQPTIPGMTSAQSGALRSTQPPVTPLPEGARGMLSQSFVMLDTMKELRDLNDKGTTGPILGKVQRELIDRGIPAGDAAGRVKALTDQLAIQGQAIIKGTPSDMDMKTFWRTIVDLGAAQSINNNRLNAGEKIIKQMVSDQLAYFKGTNTPIPPEILAAAKNYGIEAGKVAAYDPIKGGDPLARSMATMFREMDDTQLRSSFADYGTWSKAQQDAFKAERARRK